MIIQPIEYKDKPILYEKKYLCSSIPKIEFWSVTSGGCATPDDNDLLEIRHKHLYIYPVNKMFGLPEDLLYFLIYFIGEKGKGKFYCDVGYLDNRHMKPEEHYYVKVDHNYGGLDHHRVIYIDKVNKATAVPGVKIMAFLNGDKNKQRGETYTDVNGRWVEPLYLQPGYYSLVLIGDSLVGYQAVRELIVR